MNARYDEVHKYICGLVKEIERPPQGLFQYPSLATATGDTYNCGIFCWDSHHMSLRLAAVGHPEYMKYFLLTILKFQYPNGFVPSYCTPETGGGNLTDFHAQPYLAQNAAIYYSLTGDIDTVRQIYGKLELYLEYRRSISSSASGLYRWTEQWMSGFDNEVAGTFYPPDTVITPDLPALLYLEFRAMEYLARNLGKDPAKYHELADEVREAVNELLWNDEPTRNPPPERAGRSSRQCAAECGGSGVCAPRSCRKGNKRMCRDRDIPRRKPARRGLRKASGRCVPG